RLRATKDGGERFDGRARDVELWLLGRQRHAGRLCVEPQLQRALVLGAVALAHPPSPDAPRGAELGDLLEKVDVRVKEEGQPRGEVIYAHAPLQARVDVCHPISEREGELLCGGGTRLADVVPQERE